MVRATLDFTLGQVAHGAVTEPLPAQAQEALLASIQRCFAQVCGEDD